MDKLRITCESCNHVTTVDAAKVPDKPVRVACPSCGTKTVIDKRKLLAATGQPPAEGAQPAPAAPRRPSAPSVQAPQPEPEPAALVADPAAPPVEPIPSGIVVGDDDTTMDELARALAPLASTLERVAPDDLQGRLRQAVPELIVFVADEVGGPPFAPLEPVTLLAPADRRETFVVLAGSNLKTMDGSAAFFLQVNMVLNRRDIPRAGQAIASGLVFHRKLYHHYLAAEGELVIK